jgi:glutathione S-transferase
MDGGAIPKIGPKTFGELAIKPLFLGQPTDESAVEEAITVDLPPVLDYLETEIGDLEFLLADSFTIADIAVAGFFINLKHVEIEIDDARWPNVKRYCENHWQRRSIAKFIAEESELLEKVRASASSS